MTNSDSHSEPPTEPDHVVIVREDWETTLSELAEKPGTAVRLPRSPDLKRTQVVDAFLDAFQLIGATPRLAIWADENPGDFFKLWAKLAPKQIEKEVQHEGGVTIRHVLPRGPLDQ